MVQEGRPCSDSTPSAWLQPTRSPHQAGAAEAWLHAALVPSRSKGNLCLKGSSATQPCTHLTACQSACMCLRSCPAYMSALAMRCWLDSSQRATAPTEAMRACGLHPTAQAPARHPCALAVALDSQPCTLYAACSCTVYVNTYPGSMRASMHVIVNTLCKVWKSWEERAERCCNAAIVNSQLNPP